MHGLVQVWSQAEAMELGCGFHPTQGARSGHYLKATLGYYLYHKNIKMSSTVKEQPWEKSVLVLSFFTQADNLETMVSREIHVFMTGLILFFPHCGITKDSL